MKKTIVLIFAASLCVSASIFSQTVSTNTDGTPDDAIAFDSNGNIYASNFTGDSVFKITQAGDVTAFVTGLNTPNGLAFDSNDNLYVCDFSGQTIFKYDSSGAPLNSFPISGNPSGLIKSFDSDDVIYTDYNENTINRLAVDETITVISSAAELNGPVGLAYDENDNLYVGNYTNRKVYKILTDGSLEYIATVGGASNLGFIAYANGFLWGTVLGEHKIYKINPNAIDDVALFAGSTGGIADGDISGATFNQPNGILFDPNDETTMYITDFGQKNLRIISEITLGIENNEEANFDIQIYPNLVKDILFIQGVKFEGNSFNLRIIDVLGKQVYAPKGRLTVEEITKGIYVSNLYSGVYFVEIYNEEKRATKKFIK